MDPHRPAEPQALAPSPATSGGATWFVVVAYVLSYAGQVAIWIGGGLEGPLFPRLAPLVMFAPAVAAFVACRREGVPFRRLLRPRLRPAAALVALLVPAASALVAAFLIGALLGGTPLPWTVSARGIAVPAEGPFLWSGTQDVPALLGNLVLTAAWLSVLAGLLAVGEEIGWRGYLQPRLCRALGVVPGLTVVGLLWAFWHLPLLLLGYVFPEAPVIGGFLLFPLIGISLSHFLGWLREASGGIWAPVLAHGGYNAFFGALVFEMDFAGRDLAAYLLLVGITALTGAVGLAMLQSGVGGCRLHTWPASQGNGSNQ